MEHWAEQEVGMATVGAVFVLVGGVVLGAAVVLLVGHGVLRWRLHRWRTTRIRTTGAVSKLPRATAWRRQVEITYVDPAGRGHVLRRRWSPGGPQPRVGLPVTVRHRADRPEVAAVDAPYLGVPALAYALRVLGLVAGALGLLSVLVGGGLLLIVRWGHLG